MSIEFRMTINGNSEKIRLNILIRPFHDVNFLDPFLPTVFVVRNDPAHFTPNAHS